MDQAKKAERIRWALRKQLRDNGFREKDHAYLFDRVEDYIALWMTKESLIADIDRRGVTVGWQNSETSRGEKLNDSVNALVKVNAQMDKLLDFLRLRPVVVEVEEDDGQIEL